MFDQIKEEYFAHNKDSFVSTIVKGIVDDEIEELVLDLAQTNWKEALAYTLSYTTQSSKINEYVGSQSAKKGHPRHQITAQVLLCSQHQVHQ